MEFEDWLKCPKCDEPTIYYVVNRNRKIAEFYPDFHEETKIRFPTLDIQKEATYPCDRCGDVSTCDVRPDCGVMIWKITLRCPVCGERFTATPPNLWFDIITDYQILDTPGSMTKIQISDIPKSWIIASSENLEKGECLGNGRGRGV